MEYQIPTVLMVEDSAPSALFIKPISNMKRSDADLGGQAEALQQLPLQPDIRRI